MLDNRKNLSSWFVAGLGLGALTGILLAPRSGRETRKTIVAGVDDGIEQVASFGRHARRHIGNALESGKKALALKKEQAGAAIGAVKVLLKRAA
ncbi:MAG TPA: YtxH domain-containing protein [Terriglobales bacterium]